MTQPKILSDCCVVTSDLLAEISSYLPCAFHDVPFRAVPGRARLSILKTGPNNLDKYLIAIN